MPRKLTVLTFVAGWYIISDPICQSFPVKVPCYYLNRLFLSESAPLLMSRHSLGLSRFEGLHSRGSTNHFSNIVRRPFLSIRPGSLFPLLLT